MQILIATREKNVSDDLQNLIVSVGEVGWFEDFDKCLLISKRQDDVNPGTFMETLTELQRIEHLCSPGFVSPCFLFLVPSM